jgi:hypothetical protein
LKPPSSRWHKIKARVSDWWFCNDVRDTLIGWVVWIGLIVGIPLLLSMCDSKKSPDAKSLPGDIVAPYTVTYYADGAQVTDDP